MDDSTIIQVAPSPNTPLEETVKLAQKDLNIFSGESKTTGGQVITEKKMSPNGLQMAPRREIATIIQKKLNLILHHKMEERK